MTKLKYEISFINILILIQNVTGVYRNFNAFDKSVRLIVTSGIAFICVIYLSSVIHHTVLIFNAYFYKDLMLFWFIVVFKWFTTIMSVTGIIVAVQRSPLYCGLMVTINHVHKEFKSDPEYLQALRKLTIWSAIKLIVILISYLMIFVIDANFYYRKFNNFITKIMIGAHLVCLLWSNVQFYTELLMFSFLINIIVSVLKQMNKKLIVFLDCIDDNDAVDVGIECVPLLENIKLLVTQFNCLNYSCCKVRRCFGLQVRFFFKSLLTG